MPIANHRLDYTQTLKNAYDINLNRIRVDAEVSATFGDLEVSITAADGDNIAIVDFSGDQLDINPDGSLNVNVITSSTGLIKNSINTYNEISSLASGSETVVVTYTAPIAKTTYLIRAEVAGENIARYRIFLNASAIARRYTYFGGDLSTEFRFENDDMEIPGLKLTPGDVVTVRILHNRPTVADFSARIQTLEVG